MQLYITYSILIFAVIQVASSITNIKVISAYKITWSKVNDCGEFTTTTAATWNSTENFQKAVPPVKEKREQPTQGCSAMLLYHTGLA